MAPLLLFFEFLNLLIDRVVGELSEEHFFLLVNELVHVLSALLFGELNSAPSDVHGFVDMVLLL